jgi:hypothetical protein
LMLADLGAGLAARLGARTGTLAYGALLAGLVLWSAARAAPLRAMTTPYAGVRDWLLQRGADEVVVYHPYGDDNGFAWQFYFGSQAYFADTESDVLRACAEHAPAFMITAGEPLRALAGLPLVARFANPIYSTTAVTWGMAWSGRRKTPPCGCMTCVAATRSRLWGLIFLLSRPANGATICPSFVKAQGRGALGGRYE